MTIKLLYFKCLLSSAIFVVSCFQFKLKMIQFLVRTSIFMLYALKWVL